MNSRKVLWGCGIALVLGLGIVAIGLLASGLLQKLGRQLPPGVSSTLVNINLPLNGAELPLNEPVSIYAEAVSGSTVHDLELWIDGAFSPTKMDTSPADKSPLNAVWLWKPAEEGAHRLIVRAIGPDGQAVNSNVVRVSVLPREKIADLQVATVPPELLPPLGTSAEGAGFQLPGRESITPGPPPQPPQPPEQPQDPAPAPVGTPGLQGTVNQCQAALLIQDNSEDEKGFYLYRFDPTSTGFTRVATLDKHPGQGAFSYLDPGLGLGNHTYYVASFDGNGEMPSNLINLKVTEPQCAAASPQAFGLQDAMLTTSKAVDKVYCYLSVNQGPWSRIPPGDNTFIYPTAGGFDLGKYLDTLISPSPPGGVTLELECWGWSGGTLVYLGYLKQDVGPGPVQLVGNDFTLSGQGLEIVGPETFPFELSPNIAPPYNLKSSRDIAYCIDQYGGVISPSTATTVCNFTKIGYTILSWHWVPGCWLLKAGETCPYTVEDIEGYHIYRQSPGMKPVQVNSIINPKIHVAMIAPGGNGGLMIQPEYFVRAYKGSQESMDSQHIAGLSPEFTVTLRNPTLGVTNAGRLQGIHWYGDDDAEFFSHTVYPEKDVEVGYGRNTLEDPVGSYRISSTGNASMLFPMPEIKGSVTGAVLRWQFKGTVANGPGVAAPGCWISLTDKNGGVIASYPLSSSGGYDVTTQVRGWTQPGKPLPELRLVSAQTNLTFSETYDSCLFTLGDFELEIQSAE